MTSGTSGPHGFGSSASVGLASSLASRLAVVAGSLGSTLFRLTWKVRVTPSGRSIYALRASVPRTGDSAFSSWQTPTKDDAGREGDGEAYLTKYLGQGQTSHCRLRSEAQLAARPTPRATEIVTGQNAQGGLGLTSIAQMTTWATPSARDWRDGRASEETMNRNSRPLNEQAVQLADSGETPNGSPAGMERPGQLNPALPRWLMGYPEIFDHCSPGWKEWAIAQRKLEECSGDPEALWLWLARIALEDCGDTATGL